MLALLDRDFLDLGGTSGDAEAGDRSSTTSYASSTTRALVEIVVYNRAILLFTSESEAVRRIQQVCCRLEEMPTPQPQTYTRRNRHAPYPSPERNPTKQRS